MNLRRCFDELMTNFHIVNEARFQASLQAHRSDASPPPRLGKLLIPCPSALLICCEPRGGTSHRSEGEVAFMKFVLGLLAGIIAGLMLAPASGTETRRRIGESASDLAESSRETMQQVSDTARQKARQASNMASQKVQQASEYVKKAGDVAGDIGRRAAEATDAINEKIDRKTA